MEFEASVLKFIVEIISLALFLLFLSYLSIEVCHLFFLNFMKGLDKNASCVGLSTSLGSNGKCEDVA